MIRLAEYLDSLYRVGDGMTQDISHFRHVLRMLLLATKQMQQQRES